MNRNLTKLLWVFNLNSCTENAFSIPAAIHARLVLTSIAMVACMATAGVVDADAALTAVPGTVVDDVLGFEPLLHVVTVAIEVQQHLKTNAPSDVKPQNIII
jgi:hypothetical protein